MKPLRDRYYLEKCVENWKQIELIDAIKNRIEAYKSLDNYYDLYSAIVYFCEKIPVKKYLEIGVRTCGSLIHAALSDNVEKVVGIDIWKGEYAGEANNTYEIALKQVENINKDIQLIKGRSEIELLKLKEKFDLITIDGDHSAFATARDISVCLNLCEEKAVILIDDITHPTEGIKVSTAISAMKERITGSSFRTMLNNQGNGLAILYRGFDDKIILG